MKNTEPQEVPRAEEMEWKFPNQTLPETLRLLEQIRRQHPETKGFQQASSLFIDNRTSVPCFPLYSSSHHSSPSLPLLFFSFSFFLPCHLSIAFLYDPLQPPLFPYYLENKRKRNKSHSYREI